MIECRFRFAAALVVALPAHVTFCPPSLAAVPSNQVIKTGNFSQGSLGVAEFVVRLTNPFGSTLGTASWMYSDFDPVDPNRMRVTFLTADHVLRKADANGAVGRLSDSLDLTTLRIGIRSDRAPVDSWPGLFNVQGQFVEEHLSKTDDGTFRITPQNVEVYRGGPSGLVDMAVIGATIDLSGLTAAQRTLLVNQELQSNLGPGMAVGTTPTPANFTSYGFGRSGTPDLGYTYLAHISSDPISYIDEGPGLLRGYNNTLLSYESNFTIADYTYDAEKFKLRAADGDPALNMRAIAGEGMGGDGDSGAPILVGGKIQGIFTADNAAHVLNANNQLIGFGYTAGTTQGVGVRFTPENGYMPWVDEQASLYFGYLVPEPSTFVLAAIAALSLIALRRRARRDAPR